MLQGMHGSVRCNPSSQENLHFKANLVNKNNSIFKIHTNGLVATARIDAVRKSAGLDLEYTFFAGS